MRVGVEWEFGRVVKGEFAYENGSQAKANKYEIDIRYGKALIIFPCIHSWGLPC